MHDSINCLSPRNAALLRRLVQGAFFLFLLLVGVQFYFFVLWAMGESEQFVSRPPAVEAFLPISALMALRHFLSTGLYDPVHPAGLTILILALLTAFFLRKSFCGYLCPFGALSSFLFRMGKRLGLSRTLPTWLSCVVSVPKYVLLLFFVNLLFLNMSAADVAGFLQSRYNMVADTKMLFFFLPPGALTLGIIGLLLIGSLFIPSFWCRCFCPYGALMGLLSFCSPLAVRRDPKACIQCGKCTRACPSGIIVERRERVSGAECLGCLECMSACPQKDCLSLQAGYTSKHSLCLPWWSLAALTLAVLAALYLWAVFNGHWDSSIPRDMWRSLHEGVRSLRHY